MRRPHKKRNCIYSVENTEFPFLCGMVIMVGKCGEDVGGGLRGGVCGGVWGMCGVCADWFGDYLNLQQMLHRLCRFHRMCNVTPIV